MFTFTPDAALRRQCQHEAEVWGDDEVEDVCLEMAYEGALQNAHDEWWDATAPPEEPQQIKLPDAA